MKIVPRNWRDFQHYKDRNPPWIRLHRGLLDNKDFQRLPVASRALAPMLWLLASESVGGVIDADPDELAFRLRSTEKEIAVALRPLLEKGFFEPVQDASTTLAPRPQSAVPETEALQSISDTEAETETAEPKARDPHSCPAGVQPQTWADWLALRKAKKAPVTLTVVEGAAEEANKAGMTLEAFLRVWCRRGSQGLEAAWLKPEERGSPATGETAYARSMREKYELVSPAIAAPRPGQSPNVIEMEPTRAIR